MIIFSKRNIIIPSADGKVKRFIPKDYIGKVEDWVTKTDYYKALVADGKIVESNTTKDKDIDKAAEQPVIDNAKENLKAEEETETETETVEEIEPESEEAQEETEKPKRRTSRK